jgi:hypothetical protein
MLPYLSRWVDRQQWVGLRQPALQFHRRKAVIDISLPGSGRSQTRTPDPHRPFGLVEREWRLPAVLRTSVELFAPAIVGDAQVAGDRNRGEI